MFAFQGDGMFGTVFVDIFQGIHFGVIDARYLVLEAVPGAHI